jgi:hypothetical protein
MVTVLLRFVLRLRRLFYTILEIPDFILHGCKKRMDRIVTALTRNLCLLPESRFIKFSTDVLGVKDEMGEIPPELGVAPPARISDAPGR